MNLQQFGFWPQEVLGGDRNPYDKIGHFAQGFVWDTPSDMFYALIGAVAALVLLSRLHDRESARPAHRAGGGA